MTRSLRPLIILSVAVLLAGAAGTPLRLDASHPASTEAPEAVKGSVDA